MSVGRKVTPVELEPMQVLTPAPTVMATTSANLQISPSPTTKPVLGLTPSPTNEKDLGAWTQRELLLFGALFLVIVLGIGGIVFGVVRSRRR